MDEQRKDRYAGVPFMTVRAWRATDGTKYAPGDTVADKHRAQARRLGHAYVTTEPLAKCALDKMAKTENTKVAAPEPKRKRTEVGAPDPTPEPTPAETKGA